MAYTSKTEKKGQKAMVIKRSNMKVSYASTKKQATVSYYTYKPNSGFEYTCVIEREEKRIMQKFRVI
jgi:hypothetical protein